MLNEIAKRVKGKFSKEDQNNNKKPEIVIDVDEYTVSTRQIGEGDNRQLYVRIVEPDGTVKDFYTEAESAEASKGNYPGIQDQRAKSRRSHRRRRKAKGRMG